MSLPGAVEAQLLGCYDRLAEGGTVIQPLSEAPRADVPGMCSNRFAIT